MIIEMNPMKWFAPKTPAVPASPDATQKAASPAAAVVQESVAAKAEESVMSTTTKKVTFLDHIGNFFKTLLHIGVEVAQDVEPIVSLEFPEVVPIYNSAIGLAIAAQATVVNPSGSGPEKLAQVVSSLVPQVQAWAKENGIVWDDAAITSWASAIVDTLNLIPPPTVAPVAAVAAA
jgi:hypothetical protein